MTNNLIQWLAWLCVIGLILAAITAAGEYKHRHRNNRK
jgi:hypothetical protein